MRSNWEILCLEDLYSFSSGLSKPSECFGEGSPFLSFKTVFNNFFLPEELPDKVDSTIEEQEKCSVRKGDVFLTRTSETPNELGMSSVALKDYQKATFNGFTKRLRPKDSRVNPLFAAYYFRSGFFRAHVNSLTTLTTRASLNNEMLSKLPFLLPPIDIQKRIGGLLSIIDKKILVNQKINKNLQQEAQTIYNNMFVENADKSWPTGCLSDIATVTMGQSPKGDTYNESGLGTIFFQGRAEFGFRFPTKRLFTTDPKRWAQKGDILISVRAPVGDINVAHEDCCIGRGLGSVRSKDNRQSFILYTMFSLHDQLDVFNGEGTVFGSINRDALNSMPLIIPPRKTLDQFEEIVAPMDNAIRNNYDEICRLETLRDALLPSLMSGELDVSELDV